MPTLVGSTGFVGRHIAQSCNFTHSVHRTDADSIVGLDTDLLVCAGLPAEKWRANGDPSADWSNMARLARTLSRVRAERAVLVSTVDVYQPAVGVDESNPADFDGSEPYGTHRAWFECFFRSTFRDALIIRLPGLFGPKLRKNLVYDLIHHRSDQLANINPESQFQFFDVTLTWELINRAWAGNIPLLNVSSEPVTAQEIADLFDVGLRGNGKLIEYDMRSRHASEFGGTAGYIFDKRSILNGIRSLSISECSQ